MRARHGGRVLRRAIACLPPRLHPPGLGTFFRDNKFKASSEVVELGQLLDLIRRQCAMQYFQSRDAPPKVLPFAPDGRWRREIQHRADATEVEFARGGQIAIEIKRERG